MTRGDSKNSILIIDDDAAHRRLALRALEEALPSYSFVEASTPTEASTCLNNAAQAVGLVILDLHLGIASGLEVLKGIRKTKDSAELPVLILSTSSVEHDFVQSYQAGANCYVVKAIDPSTFRQNLGKAARFLIRTT